jgi:hypothetical protein
MVSINKPALLWAFHYLKTPNFKHHPLNYVFVIAFFFVGFFPAQAFAGNTYYSYHTGDGSDRAVGVDQEAACGNWGGSWVDGVQCWANPDKTGGSPVGYWNYCYAPTNHYVSDTAPHCSDSPAPDPVNCPEGELAVVSYEFMSSSSGSFPTQIIKNGCSYSPVGAMSSPDFQDMLDENPLLDKNGFNTECVTLVDGSDIKCIATTVMKSVGENAEPSTPNVEADPSTDEQQDRFDEAGYKKTTDTTSDHEEKTLGEKITESLNDGSTVETKTDTHTITKGDGTKVKKDTETTTVTRTDGIKKKTTVTETTVTKPDGSTVKTTTENVTYTKSPEDKWIVKKNADGTVSITVDKSAGSQSGATTTSKKCKDSEGKTTCDESKTTGDDDAKQAGDCEKNPNDFACQKVTVGTDKLEGPKSFWKSNYPDGMDGILASAKTSIAEEISNSGMADTGISGSGSNPTFTFDMDIGRGMDLGRHSIKLDSKIWQFISLCFYITTLWLCRSLVFGG